MLHPDGFSEFLWVLVEDSLKETRDKLAEFIGQTLGIDEECRAQRMIECEQWEEN